MFDIGLNLTSSQFAKDRDEVVARAFAAGVKGLLLTGTNLHESERSSWRNVTIAVGLLLACILTTAASGPQKVATPCTGWQRRQTLWLSANAVSISTVTFPRLKSRKRRLLPSLRWRQSLECPCLCTAATRMSVSC